MDAQNYAEKKSVHHKCKEINREFTKAAFYKKHIRRKKCVQKSNKKCYKNLFFNIKKSFYNR
tara:strand:+ start:8689 stop:8874 length:186 start_codon:yes stop_codon:yes gene_type:complete